MSVLIVGAGPGMGAALAHRLGSAADSVGLIGRNAQTLEAIIDDLGTAGITAKAAAADIGDESELRAAIGGLSTEIGSPRTVIFNASAFVDGPPSTVDTTRFAAGLAVGITGALVTLQAVTPAMTERGSGTILFTGGGTAIRPWTAACGLSVQKAGMRNLAIAAAEELTKSGIHVCTITIMGTLTPNTVFDPKLIANSYADVIARPPPEWEPEVTYAG